MRSISHFAAAMLVFCAASAVAASPDNATAEQIAANAQAEILGEQIYDHDQAAWRASDALRAQTNFAGHPEIGGYVTDELDDGAIAVIYFIEDEGALYEFARVAIDGAGDATGGLRAEPTDFPLSEAMVRSVSARAVALDLGVKEQVQLCTAGSANIVTLPPNAEDQIAVYILSSPVVPGRFPLGGHYRVLVGAENEAISGRPYNTGCWDAPMLDRYTPAGPDAYQLVHVLDQQPTEIHYFAARNMRVPLSVTTGEITWMIDHSDWSAEEIAAGEALASGVPPQ